MPNVAGQSGIHLSETFYQAASSVVRKSYVNNAMKVPTLYPQYLTRSGNDPKRGFMNFLPIVEFGTFPVKPEGAGPVFDTAGEGLMTTYNFVVYSLGYKISKEGLRRDPMGLINKMPGFLAYSEGQTKDLLLVQQLNLGFTNAAGGGYNLSDGQPLFSASHPLGGGTVAQYGTQSNTLGATSLTPEAINQSDILFQTMLSDRGLAAARTPKILVVPPQQRKIAEEVIGSTHAPYSNDNRINTAYQARKILVNRYLTSTTAWFDLASPGGENFEADTHSLIYSFQWENETTTWTDPGTGNFNQRAEFCITFGPLTFRGTVGSQGA